MSISTFAVLSSMTVILLRYYMYHYPVTSFTAGVLFLSCLQLVLYSLVFGVIYKYHDDNKINNFNISSHSSRSCYDMPLRAKMVEAVHYITTQRLKSADLATQTERLALQRRRDKDDSLALPAMRRGAS